MFIELSDDDNRHCLKLVQVAIEKQYFDLESLLMTMLSFKGAKIIKKLLMEDVSTNLPKAAFSPLWVYYTTVGLLGLDKTEKNLCSVREPQTDQLSENYFRP